MSALLKDQDLMLLDRYLDGELSPEQRAICAARLAAEPALRAGLEERTQLRRAFRADGGGGGRFVPRPGFADRVLAATHRLPVEVAADSASNVVKLCQRILLVAAAVFAAAMLWQSGMFTDGGDSSLQAAPDEVQQIVDDLDAKIRERAAAAGRK